MTPSPPVLLLRDPRAGEHAPPGPHPERPERLQAVDAALEPLRSQTRPAAPRPASDEELLRVHDRDLLTRLEAGAGRNTRIDADTYAAPTSAEVARRAAGGAIDMALEIAAGRARAGLALVRPPGHHAERDRAMGFCLLNHVAIAARALEAAGLERLAIADIDVHHGNGTQHAFESERDVLFVSTHQFPFYPGTGSLDERGSGAGEGATLNLPLPAGAGDGEYAAVFERIALPRLLAFRPEMILVSAGYDAHAADPLASMELSTPAYAWLTARLRQVAEEVCDGRLLLLLEGGYALDALGASVAASLRALVEPKADAMIPEMPGLRAGWEPVVDELLAAARRDAPL